MEAKIAEAVAARRDRDFLIIARTNASRVTDLDDALRRAEAFHRCGADVLLVMPRNFEELRTIGERLPAPLMYMLPTEGIQAVPFDRQTLCDWGFRLVIDPATPLFSMTAALRRCYEALARSTTDPTTGGDAKSEERAVLDAIGLEGLLAIERRTVERDAN
jgi:methylisocitrate lyase